MISPSGDCVINKGMIKFLKDEKNTCSNSFINDFNSCIEFNGKRIFNKNSFSIIAGISGDEKQIKFVKENVKFKKIQNRFYTYDYDWLNVTSVSKFERLPLQATISECVCTNIVTKVEYNFYVEKTEIKDYEAIYYVEDVTDSCGAKIYKDLSYEVNFKNYNKVK